MAKIKSALELALEKTADLKVDRQKIRKDDVIKQAKSEISKILSKDNEVESWQQFYQDLKTEEQPGP